MTASRLTRLIARLRHGNQWVLLITTIPTLIIAAALLFNWWPMLRGGFGWRWPYIAPESQQLSRLLPFVVGLATYLLGLHLLSKRASWLYVSWCVLGTVLLTVTALMGLGNPLYLLFSRTVSGLTTGGFSVAVRNSSLSETLHRWPELMPSFESFSSHMAISPPGWYLTYFFLGKWLDALGIWARPLANILRPLQCNDVQLMQLSNGQIASTWLGIASPFWAGLTAIPLYDLGRRVNGDSVARLATAWWPIVPSLLMFTGTLSTPYPLGGMIVFWLFWTGLDHTGANELSLRVIAAGALTGLLLLYSFAFLPFVLFLGLLALLKWRKSSEQSFWHYLLPPMKIGFQFGVGLALIMILYTATSGHSLLVEFESAMDYHMQLSRAYWPWLALHTWDYVLFLGLTMFLLFLIGCFQFTEGPIRKIAVALGIAMLIVILSGTGRGETGRIWLYFVPFSILIAARVAHAVTTPYRRVFLVTHVTWLFVMLMVLRTVESGFSPPPELAAIRYPTAAVPATPTDFVFGDNLRLQGFRGHAETEPPQIVVDLYWQPIHPVEAPLFFSAAVVSPDGVLVGGHQWQPFDYQFPTTCWYAARKEGGIVDRVTIPLPVVEATSTYWLSLRLFEIGEGEVPSYVQATVPGTDIDDQVGLGPIRTAASANE